jgi:hypothetical protein
MPIANHRTGDRERKSLRIIEIHSVEFEPREAERLTVAGAAKANADMRNHPPLVVRCAF